ncbi:MAG: glycosyltransferase family 2 protein [Anaerohalosphaeraceae bacterium]
MSDIFFILACVFLVGQVLITVQVISNTRYALKKSEKVRDWYRPPAIIIVPCKGLDAAFEQNILSFFHQEYQPYRLWFAVEDPSDPAYSQLNQIIARYSPQSSAQEIRVLVTGRTTGCSQKLHNILFCYRQIPADVEVLVFADSDACADNDWLSHIVYPFHSGNKGAASGYRWFVPKTNNAATLALSCINAVVGQVLGNTRFNQAWGGSMAIPASTFRELDLESIWSRSISDDLTLSSAVRQTGKKMIYVPSCMVASYETTTWPKLFEFVRRQFLITRVYAIRTWLFGLFSIVFSVCGLWLMAAAAAVAWHVQDKNAPFFAIATGGILLAQFIRAVFRQRMICRLLEKDKTAMRMAVWADILLFWVWGIILLICVISSAFGKTICWRGICYRMNGPLDVVVEK